MSQAKSSVLIGEPLKSISYPVLDTSPRLANALPYPEVGEALTPTMSPTVALS